MSGYLATFDERVAGIPCQVGVLSFWEEAPSAYCPGGSECEYRLLDQSGRVAPWLERKLTSADEDRIYERVRDEVAA